VERLQRKRQIEALKYERAINDELARRISALLSALESHTEEARTHDPTAVAFRALMQSTPRNGEDDNPPPRPEGLFDGYEPLPTYSKMVARILDEVKKTLDEKGVEVESRYDAMIGVIKVHLQKIRELQSELLKKLDRLEAEETEKITSEDYHVGFDSSHVSKAKPGETKQRTKLELLNPNYDLRDINSDTMPPSTTGTTKESDEEVINKASAAAKQLAQIKISDYPASRAYLLSHPEILRESEVDGLLIEAFDAALDRQNLPQSRQYVHQATLLDYCRRLGRDGMAIFFKHVTTPGHKAREMLEKDTSEKYQRVLELARDTDKQRASGGGREGVEQIQIHPVEPGASIQIRIPQEGSEIEEVKRARSIFDSLAPEMRAALESGSLEEVNKVLGAMAVLEAEVVVGLLGEVSLPYRGAAMLN